MSLSILTFFEQLFNFAVQGIFGLLEGSVTFIFSQIGGGLSGVFANFTAAIESYGQWSLALIVVVIFVTFIGVYAILSMGRIVDDFV